MRFLKCLALSAVVFGVLSVHVQGATPVTEPSRRAVQKLDQPAVAADPAAMATACPATVQGMLISGGVVGAGGSWTDDTTGLTNDFEDDYPSSCSYSSSGGSGADEIHTFQVDTTGVWSFDTSQACWDTSLGLRVDSGGGCPGDAVACDGDSLSDCYYESLLTAFLVAGTDYFMVVDGWTQGQEGPYNVNYSLVMAACTDDAACDDGDPCNGGETCNLGNGQCEAGTPPCDRGQTCNPDGSCTDPDPCYIYSNRPLHLGIWEMPLASAPDGTIIADDWEFAGGSLGRALISYSILVKGWQSDFSVETSLWPHSLVCAGGANDGGECDTEADCTGFTCVGGVNDGLTCASTNPDCPGICDDGITPCFEGGDCAIPESCHVADCPTDGTCDDRGFTPGRCDNSGAVCLASTECPVGGTCIGRRRPGHTEIAGTQCAFVAVPAGYFVNVTCSPAPGVTLPPEGIWQGVRFVNALGWAEVAVAGQPPEIGSSTDVFAWDEGTNGQAWRRFWFGGGDLANWVGDLCTTPVGACCTPPGTEGATCTIETEQECTGGGGSIAGFNNAVHQFDCSADSDGDGTVDPCDACPENAEFAENPGPCNCDSTDTDADGTLDCVDQCPDEAAFAADKGPCGDCSTDNADGDLTAAGEPCYDCIDRCPFSAVYCEDPGPCACDPSDLDNDGTLDCVDGCPNDPAKIAPGVCGCGIDDDADSDGDGVPDCNDQCNGVDDAVFAPGCVGAIPTVSKWGLVILALLLLAAGKVYFGRKSATA